MNVWNTMKRKVPTAVMLAVLVAVLSALSGCAGGGGAEATGAGAEAAPAEAEAAAGAEAEAAAGAGAEAADAGTHIIVDHNGDEVEIPYEIDRVAVTTIYPLPAMLSMYLGSAEKIVGMHSVSMAAAQNGILGKLYPEILTADTGWIEGEAINIEELLKLEPDVVFYSAPNAAEGEALRSAGIPAIGVHATKWEFDCIRTFDEWVALLDQIFPGQDRVAGVSDYARETLAGIQEKVADVPDGDRPRALFLFQYDDTVMITSGKHFFGQYWIDAAGGVNVAEELEEVGSNATIGMEQVLAWNPEKIYITNFTPTQPQDLYDNAVRGDDWSGVAAVQSKEVYKMPLGAYRSYTPGVDTPLTLLWMAKTMYPDLFADVDLTAEVKAYYQDYFGITLTDDDVEQMYNPSSAAGVSGFMNK